MENRFKILSFTVTEDLTYVAFSKAKASKKEKKLANSFAEVLKQMKQDGFIESVYSK